MGYGDASEFATEEFLTYNTVMENFVIVRKNPDYEEEIDTAQKKK